MIHSLLHGKGSVLMGDMEVDVKMDEDLFN